MSSNAACPQERMTSRRRILPRRSFVFPADVERVARPPAITGSDVQEAVGSEHELAAVVVGLRGVLDAKQPGAASRT